MLKRQEELDAYVNPLHRAYEYQKILHAEGLNQNQLAKKLGISRVRVNQHLALLKLSQEKQSYILQYGKEKQITERELRQRNKRFTSDATRALNPTPTHLKYLL